jgi:hypothetical protein
MTPLISARSVPRRPVFWLGVILAAGLVMRVDRLGGRSYWFDEGFTWKLIGFPWREMIERIARDNHVPGYFLLAKLWAGAFGDSPWSLRFLSVLMGELAILGVYLLVREAFQEGRPEERADARVTDGAAGVGLLAATLVAFSVFQIRWATEVRMYSLGAALAAFSGWLLLRALCRPEPRFGRWLSYAVVTALFAYTHPYALFSIAAQAVFAAGYVAARNGWRPVAIRHDPRARALFLSYGMVFVLWSPWLPVLLAQKRQVSEAFWLPPMSWWVLSTSCYQMFSPDQYAANPSTATVALVTLACAVGFAALLWRGGPADWLVFLTGVVPVALSATLSLIQTNIFHRRYLLFAHLSFLAMIAVLIFRIRPVPARRATAAAVLIGALALYADYARDRASRAAAPGARAASTFLDGRRAPGELAVVSSPMLTPVLEGHSRDRAGWRTYKPRREYYHYEGTAVIRPEEYLTDEGLEALSGERVWVVDIEGWGQVKHSVPIPSGWVRKGEWRFPEIYSKPCAIIVREYETPPGAPRRSDEDHLSRLNRDRGGGPAAGAVHPGERPGVPRLPVNVHAA